MDGYVDDHSYSQAIPAAVSGCRGAPAAGGFLRGRQGRPEWARRPPRPEAAELYPRRRRTSAAVAEGTPWIDLLDPSEDELRKALPDRIHTRALELLLQPARHDDEPRPRLEGHDHYVFGLFLVPVCIREED